MRIEEGKFYRAANGAKIGPMKSMNRVFIQEVGDGYSWNPDGTCYAYRTRYRSDHHLVAEWVEPAAQWFLDIPNGPIVTETVTTRRLEPGVYGPLNLLSDRSAGSFVRLALVRELHNSTELRELARVALEIAEYLDAQ